MLLVICFSVISSKNEESTAIAVEGVNAQAQQSLDKMSAPTPAPVVISVPAFEVMSEGTMLVDSDRWNDVKEDFKGSEQLILPQYDDAVISIEEVPLYKKLRIMIDNVSQSAYDIEMIQRVAEGQYFIGAASDTYINDLVKNISLDELPSVNYAGMYTAVIDIELSNIFVPQIHEYNDVYCIDLRKPHDVYEHIIVVDAGHGGKDAGCNSPNWEYYEKNSTVKIVKRLKEKLDKTNIKVYYTRLDDSTVYLRPRVELANDLDADMFISIHCNYYDRYWYYNVHGAEALYSSKYKAQKLNSKKLAGYMLDSLVDSTDLSKRSVVDRKSELYILRKSTVPSTIVETAYMSNSSDLAYLIKKQKIKKIADGLFNGISKAYYELYGVQITTN